MTTRWDISTVLLLLMQSYDSFISIRIPPPLVLPAKAAIKSQVMTQCFSSHQPPAQLTSSQTSTRASPQFHRNISPNSGSQSSPSIKAEQYFLSRRHKKHLADEVILAPQPIISKMEESLNVAGSSFQTAPRCGADRLDSRQFSGVIFFHMLP